jgi:hypothetical protein
MKKIDISNLNEDIIAYLLNEDTVSKYNTDTESDIDELDKQLSGKGILKVNPNSHSIDGTNVSFNCVIIVGSLEYNINFNNGESSAFITMSNGQNLIPLSKELLMVFNTIIEYFDYWKQKWNTIISTKN